MKQLGWHQKTMAQLFGVEVSAIIKHIANILAEATTSKMEVVQQEGARSVRRMVYFYNLDMIIAIG